MILRLGLRNGFKMIVLGERFGNSLGRCRDLKRTMMIDDIMALHSTLLYLFWVSLQDLSLLYILHPL